MLEQMNILPLTSTSKRHLYCTRSTSNTQRTECSHVQRTIQIEKVHRRQPPPPERGSSPLPWDSIEPEAKETSIHKASKQQMASTGNLPLERLHCCLHIFLNAVCLYQNSCLFLTRSPQKRQRKATCKALNRRLKELLKRTNEGGQLWACEINSGILRLGG